MAVRKRSRLDERSRACGEDERGAVLFGAGATDSAASDPVRFLGRGVGTARSASSASACCASEVSWSISTAGIGPGTASISSRARATRRSL